MQERAVNKTFEELAKELSTRQLRNALKRSYRSTAKKARAVAVEKLRARVPNVQGNRATFEKGIRTHIYTRGGGFLITLKPRQANSKRGITEKSMHENRYYSKTKRRLPVLQWLEDGVKPRYRRVKGKGALSKMKRKAGVKGGSTGSFSGRHFLEAAKPQMIVVVETNLGKELEVAVNKIANKVLK